MQRDADGISEREILARLIEIVGAPHVLTAEKDLDGYTIDWTGRYRGTGRVVVRPASTSEVADIVRLCRNTQTSLVPQGGNTGLVGGSIPLKGEIVLSTRRLSSIGVVDTAARQVTVGAGAILADVQRAAQVAGLRYPVDFGARDSATIGGTIATNAGGVAVLRYGMTRRHVVGVESVLGTGESVSHLGGLVKDNTGYDLAGLLCGSEGTLGVVTAARLQLVPSHVHRSTALIGFEDIGSAMNVVVHVCSQREDIDALEIFFESGVQLVQNVFGRRAPFSAPVHLLIELSSDEDRSESVIAVLGSSAGVTDVVLASSEAMRERLWQLREEHTPAINSLGPPLKFDVTIPLARLADFVAVVETAVNTRAPQARTFIFGHAADGNLHVNVSGVGSDPTSVNAVEDVVMGLVGDHGGSVSAEHGIGTAKKRFLTLSRSQAEIDAMKAVKRAFDPDGIMNPNVLFV